MPMPHEYVAAWREAEFAFGTEFFAEGSERIARLFINSRAPAVCSRHTGSSADFQAAAEAFPYLPRTNEGDGAPGGAACNLSRALLAKSAAPTGAPPEDFSSGLFAAFSFGVGPRFLTVAFFTGRGVSQLLAGDHLVSPGGAPTPPGTQADEA
jgi:hypothetical protein